MDLSTLLLLTTTGISIWGFQDRQILNKLMLSPYRVVHKKEWYRVISHAFIHADWMHLLFNMIALWSFGTYVRNEFASITVTPGIHFFVMYFGAIVFSSIADLVKHKDNGYYLSLGASGAVSAVVFSSIFFNPWSLIFVFFIPIPGILFGVVYLWYSSYMGKRSGDNINHGAHFYGSVFGFIYPLFIEPSAFHVFYNALIHPSFL